MLWLLNHAVCRNKRKNTSGDDSRAMEDFRIFNGLECKIACSSSKVCPKNSPFFASLCVCVDIVYQVKDNRCFYLKFSLYV